MNQTLYVGFSFSWPVNRLCGILFNYFIDWRYIHSWLVFSTQLVNCCPHGRRNYTCVLLPLSCTFSLTSSPSSPPFPMYSIYSTTDSVWLWGGGVLKCTVDHILQEFYTLFLTRFRTYKVASPPQTKMTSKDDIKGLVSLKFLRPWPAPKIEFRVSVPATRWKVWGQWLWLGQR